MHVLQSTLINLGLSSNDSFEPYFPGTRDNEQVKVLRCNKSGVIILDSIDHMDTNYYANAENESLFNIQDSRLALIRGAPDNLRRKEKYMSLIIGKKYLDFGAGAGGMLKTFKPFAKEVYGVELQQSSVNALSAEGFNIATDVKSFAGQDFEVVSLFHVAEHLIHPIETLKDIHGQMKTGGKIIVEVPHAGDALLGLYQSEAFKKFTFWSQHLLLHTRASLKKFVEMAGFKNVVIEGVQRYPLSNHLHWLAKGKPGGHLQWAFLNQPGLTEAYAQALQATDMTDTIVLMAEK